MRAPARRLSDFRLATIRARLLAGFGISITLLLVAGVLGWFGLQRTNVYSERTVAELSAKTEQVERVVTAVLREVIGGMRHVQAGTPEEAQRYRALAANADRVLQAASLDPMLGTQERLVLERITQLQTTLERRIASASAWQRQGRPIEAAAALDSTSGDVGLIETELAALRDAVRRGSGFDAARMQSTQRQSEWSLAVVILLALAVAAFFGASTARAVSQPLAALQQEMAALGAGDLRQPPETAATADVAAEFVDLQHAVAQARDRLRALLREVQSEADRVTLAASELTASALAAAASSQHVTSAVTGISHGAARQLAALNDASSAVCRLAEAGATIGEAVEETGGAGRDIRATANATRAQVQKALDVLSVARETVLESQREMSGLRDATGAVDDFVSVISEIATQTNLLALNAAIEAARAGAAGRGFAVVAQEVRALAEQSATAAHEVTANVHRIRAQLATASHAVESGATRLRDVGTVAADVSGALSRIETVVSRVETSTERVVVAVQTNRASLGAVQTSLTSARDASEGHAAAAHEVAANTEQTSASAQEVSGTAEMLQTASVRLRSLVGGFRT